MTAAAPLLWTPPDGMDKGVASEWRAFYRKMARGDGGYFMTPREYRLLYIAQRGRCWICRKAKGIHPDDPKGRGSRRLAGDHDHLTGAVRGLLCSGSVSANTCNRLIERYTPEALARAAEYKRTPPALVLRAVNLAVNEMADATGIGMSRDQEDALALAYLWRDEE